MTARKIRPRYLTNLQNVEYPYLLLQTDLNEIHPACCNAMPSLSRPLDQFITHYLIKQCNDLVCHLLFVSQVFLMNSGHNECGSVGPINGEFRNSQQINDTNSL